MELILTTFVAVTVFATAWAVAYDIGNYMHHKNATKINRRRVIRRRKARK